MTLTVQIVVPSQRLDCPTLRVQAGSGNVMGRPQLGRSGSRDRDLGGRAARRSADSGADMERRSAQERMFALDLEKVLSGADDATCMTKLSDITPPTLSVRVTATL